MTESTSTPAYDVLVVGSDAAALVAALDCARIGLRVVVFATPADAHRPSVFSHRGGIVASLLTELEIAAAVRGSGDEAVEAAQGTVMGIPANPFALTVRQALGWRGAWRLYLDRIMPLLTIGTETNLGALVRRRFGKAAVAALVDPVLRERYGRTADEVSIAAVIPGLNQAMTRAGSLTTGIIDLIVADPRVAQTVEVARGMQHIEDVLRERLEFFSARIVDVTDVELSLGETTSDVLVTFGARARSGEEEIFVQAHSLLVSLELATVPEGAPESLVGEVGISSRLPGLESAIPPARAASAAIRRVLLSDPQRLPMGPLDREG
jgi:oxygen-dependent protoporphyrinogen oxidase